MTAYADTGSPMDGPSHNPQQPLSPPTSEQPATPHVHTLLAVDLEPFKQLGILPTLIAGWSAFPDFMLLLTTSLKFLYTHFAPFLLIIKTEPQSIESFAAITVRVLLLLFACQNVIDFSWDMFVDSVRQRPTLNPLLFRICREATRALGCKRFPDRLMFLLHLTSALALAGSLRLANRFNIVDLGPLGGSGICWLFLLNFVGKAWCFQRFTPCCGKGLRSRLSCFYMSCSEAVLLLLVLAPDLNRVAISTTGDHDHSYPWVETSGDGQRQILTLNFFILVLTNVAPFCLFSALVCKMGLKALEDPADWQAVVEPCRILLMTIAAIGWGVFLYATGLLPSFFSPCLLITGASTSRFLLFLIVEGIRLGVIVSPGEGDFKERAIVRVIEDGAEVRRLYDNYRTTVGRPLPPFNMDNMVSRAGQRGPINEEFLGVPDLRVVRFEEGGTKKSSQQHHTHTTQRKKRNMRMNIQPISVFPIASVVNGVRRC